MRAGDSNEVQLSAAFDVAGVIDEGGLQGPSMDRII